MPIGRQEGGADDVVHIHQRPQRLRLLGVKQLHVEPVQSLQENCFVPRKGAKGEGDGYVMAIASNYESMTSDLVIADAQRLDEGVIATVKLPFKLRSGTHTNWYPQSVLPPVKDELS